MKKIGIIADTHFSSSHGLHSEVSSFFSDVSLILHAGDIGDHSEYKKLRRIAPVTAVMGNKKYDIQTYRYPDVQSLIIDSLSIYLTHYQGSTVTRYFEYGISKVLGSKSLAVDWLISRLFNNLKTKPGIIIFGHTHEICLRKKENILFLNPGAAFSHKKRPGSIAKLMIYENGEYEIIFKYLSSNEETSLK